MLVKRGARGSTLYAAGENFEAGNLRQLDAPAFPVAANFTAGAGDSFNSGFLYAVQQGWSLEEALRFGSAAAALVVASPRGILGAPTRSRWRRCLRHRRECAASCRVATRAGAVHPHGRGEYVADAHVEAVSGGSPPRAWGIHGSVKRNYTTIRFTPTGVGNTDRTFPPAPTAAVHPHGRGEYAECIRPATNVDGSPPRAWGILI